MNTALVVALSDVDALALPIVNAGAGMTLLIVPTPCAVPSLAFVGVPRFTSNVRSVSYNGLPITGTVIVCVVTPGGNVSVPETL